MKTFNKIAILLFIIVAYSSINAQTAYTLPELGYGYSALEPYIDSSTMYIHLNKHHAAYVKNLNDAIKGTDAEKLGMNDLLKDISKYSTVVRNNAGGHYNHSLFWKNLTPQVNTQASPRLQKALLETFGSMDSLKTLLNKAAISQFGSGWAWLVVTPEKKLVVCATPNQDNPMMDIAPIKGTPIIAIDVWEHAYYLKYQNKRADYLNSIWNILNWNEISQRYETIVPKGKFDDWPALKDFHKVMSQTFHPSEDGNLTPIKTRIGEMVTVASLLKQSTIPAEFNRKEVVDAVAQLEKDSKKLQKQIQAGASDDSIKKSLSNLHDVFHHIVGLCSNEDH